ncbi:hypothetical protein E2C01_017464 [Portunus trituberculatus]|uniref:Uncharacterized protein n=1 Tax=Portunus trituberculatus TaxID=210409 RepID=A0A5B7DTS4_PORTR|nr:hypothetical protein [Portunus trituberculatus]
MKNSVGESSCSSGAASLPPLACAALMTVVLMLPLPLLLALWCSPLLHQQPLSLLSPASRPSQPASLPPLPAPRRHPPLAPAQGVCKVWDIVPPADTWQPLCLCSVAVRDPLLRVASVRARREKGGPPLVTTCHTTRCAQRGWLREELVVQCLATARGSHKTRVLISH